ncbi:uncharacterized protein LOC128218936 [Mya arenaria]|uniref:uncharacterized protein LOC128218936 n=1 Tax=Mya arenaria TaxID=6604 RepID=UPI0022E3CC73|nr:uncharacterized protein LOC128218936 [Mya arenaria]
MMNILISASHSVDETPGTSRQEEGVDVAANFTNECKPATCTNYTSQKKKKSISEELQEAQLQFFISQTEKVQLQKLLIKEEIETSKTKRLLMNKLITSIENKDEIGMFQFLVDE